MLLQQKISFTHFLHGFRRKPSISSGATDRIGGVSGALRRRGGSMEVGSSDRGSMVECRADLVECVYNGGQGAFTYAHLLLR